MFSGFHFNNLEYLYGLLLIPLLIFLFLIFFIRKKQLIKRFGKIEIISTLMPYLSYSRPVLKFIILLSAIVLIIFALARPQFGSQLKEVKTKGSEIIIALDISNSMLATDDRSGMNRLQKAKNVITKIINNTKTDKIGIIVFAGEGHFLSH